MSTPTLQGEARRAVAHRGSHLQIIACAGSGKTEIVAQRTASLFAEGVEPEQIVAFTFTERAAEELKNRIKQRTAERMGEEFLGRLNGCFVGTIHSYCFRLLQENVARYETYDVLDEHRLAAFLTRISRQIDLKSLDSGGHLFRAIPTFIRNLDVVENELIPVNGLDYPFRKVAEDFLSLLERYRLLTYGQVIARAVDELGDSRVFELARGKLRYLIVDEYQDINPAQEALIGRLAEPPVELCVVGDDDQAIYQWRGSNVSKIVGFQERYPGVASFTIGENRRSRPAIVVVADAFAKSIQGRLPKSMNAHRPPSSPAIARWRERTEAEEARCIARTIDDLVARGFAYRDIAVLVRGSTSYPRLLGALKDRGVPVQPGGSTGLFEEDEAQLFGRTFSWLAGMQWRPQQYGRNGISDDSASLAEAYASVFALTATQRAPVESYLGQWHGEVDDPSGPANLIDRYYDLLSLCGVAEWDFRNREHVARLGTLARCSGILADYESVRRRARPDPDNVGRVIGGQDRGRWYYFWLATHIQNWALGAYEGFEGEDRFTLDAVDVTTVHKAKGLEWPIVFMPSLSANRFPSRKTGSRQNWLVPMGEQTRARYEGTVNDERRLFYVGLTRAREWLSLSTHDTPNKQAVKPSPFFESIGSGHPPCGAPTTLPEPVVRKDESEETLAITFSELADYKACGLAFRLRNLIGFQPPLAPELGYGKAVHHVLRNIGEHTRRHQRPPDPAQLDLMFDEEFYLPLANKRAHEQMKSAARTLVNTYVGEYGEELKNMWAVERPFELHLDNAVVSGRADVILEDQGGSQSLVIVDYKTATNDELDYGRQLQVYTDAGRREGLTVRAAYVHDLHKERREPVDVGPMAVTEAENEALDLIDRIRAGQFEPNPGQHCVDCDVRRMCRHAAV